MRRRLRILPIVGVLVATMTAGSLLIDVRALPRRSIAQHDVQAAGIEPGILRLKVDRVWPYFQGEGITVAIIGSGVDFEHPAIARQYRGRLPNGEVDHNYNWADFAGSSPYPTDPTGNGTFYTGLMVGDDGLGNQIGVAPKARWIAVRAMTPEQRHAAFRWLLAPCKLDGSDCDPEKAPEVVLGAFYDDLSLADEFEADIQALHERGIVTVFAVGNAHQGQCGSASPPATLGITLGVGAVDAGDRVWDSSGRGAITGTIKPDLTAPGVNVRSAWTNGTYFQASSTIASAAYVAGILALLKESNPGLSPQEVYNVLRATADGIADRCGSGPSSIPNNVYGWGVPNALRSITSTAVLGRLLIDVSSSGGLDLSGAQVTVTHEIDGSVHSGVLDSSGHVGLAIPPGGYSVSVADVRHYTSEVHGVQVRVLDSTSVELTLQELPRFQLYGQIVDGAGRPLRGYLDLRGPDALRVDSNEDGYFSTLIHQGRYSYSALAPSYVAVSGELDLITDTALTVTLDRSSRLLVVHRQSDGPVLSRLVEAGERRGLQVDTTTGLPTREEVLQHRYVVWLGGSGILSRASEVQGIFEAGGGLLVASEDLAGPEFLSGGLGSVFGIEGYYPDMVPSEVVTVTLNRWAAQGPYKVRQTTAADGWRPAADGITAAVGPVGVLAVAREGPGRSLLLGIDLGRFEDDEIVAYLSGAALAWITGAPDYGIIHPMYPDVVPDRGGVRFTVDLPQNILGWREIRASQIYSPTRSRRVVAFRAVDGSWPEDPARVSLAWTFDRRRAPEIYLWGRKGDGSLLFLGAIAGASYAPGVPTVLDADSGGRAVGAVRALSDRGLTGLPAGYGEGNYGFDQPMSLEDLSFSLVRSVGYIAPPGQNYLDLAIGLGIYGGSLTEPVSKGEALAAIYRTMTAEHFWRSDVSPVDPPAPAWCPRRPGSCTVRLYAGMAGAPLEVRQATATYLHYVGPVPGVDARRYPNDPLQWAAPADRAWFAQVLWKVLQHRESIRGRTLPRW